MSSHGLSACSQNQKKKGNKSGGKYVTVMVDSEIIIGELNGRVCLNDHIVSIEKQQPVGCKSERADLALSVDKRNEVNINDLTTVLQETTVARWDDVEVPVALAMESDKLESISIGYIGDEWRVPFI
ncbi:hypothetical protein Leryth_010327 [Lithospermum erythrorhizon]|nr:hypothetical protein Leryth_010327 [Lithospermum erythrorhizon]